MGAVGKVNESSGLPLSSVEFGTTLDADGNWTNDELSANEFNAKHKNDQLKFVQLLMNTGAFGNEQMSVDDAIQNMDWVYAESLGYDFNENNEKYPKIPAVGIARWKNGAWEKGYGDDRQAFDKMYGISNYIDKNPAVQLNTDNNLYRGVKSSDQGIADLKNAFKNGDMVSMNGLSSWTSMRGMAEQFTHTSLVEPSNGYKPVIFIDTTKGRRNAMPYPFSGQAEVLSSGSARYKITGIEEKDGVTYVTVKQ